MSKDRQVGTQGKGSERSAKAGAFFVVVVLFCVWNAWPALTSVHLEAFTAQLQSIAIEVNRHGRHGLMLADQNFPITTEFLYMSRSGLVDLLQLGMKLTGSENDWVFRAINLISFTLFAWSTIAVAKRWSASGWSFLLLAFALTPGLVEIGYFFSDNLPSAAFAMTALACVPKEGTTNLRWLLVGCLVGMAMLVRFDGILVSAALLPCLFLYRPKVQTVALRTALGVGGLVAVIGLAQLLTPFRLGESMQITKLFTTLHEWITGDDRLKIVATGFFGYLTLPLCAIGSMRVLKDQSWGRKLCLVALPVLYYMAILPKAIEIRMFLLLGAPAVVILSASGLEWIAAQWQRTDASIVPRLVRPIAVSLSLFTLFGPMDIVIRDGPRTPVGRFWAPLLWNEWQQSVDQGLGEIDKVVAQSSADSSILVITGHYNADDYFRLRALQAGFDFDTSRPMHGSTEIYSRGHARLTHVRCPDPYLLLGQWYGQEYYYTQALETQWGLEPLNLRDFQRVYNINYLRAPGLFDPAIQVAKTPDKQWEAYFPQAPFILTKAKVPDGVIDVQQLSPKQVELLVASAKDQVKVGLDHAKNWHPIQSEQEFRSKFNWRFGTSP